MSLRIPDPVVPPPRIDEDLECRCGRKANKLHCPACGSSSVYGLASKSDTITDAQGVSRTVPVFRCRRCTLVFNYVTHRLNCEAPLFSTPSMREKRKMDAAQEAVALLSKDRMGRLNELLGNKEVVLDESGKGKLVDITEAVNGPTTK